jgi:hypothetical protein
MRFDFYNQLSDEDKIKYDRMLETHYILTRCDEFSFIETDENGEKSLSSSFMLSLQQAKKLWGVDSTCYPQGSISANRNNYEAIRNYLGDQFKSDYEVNRLRKGLTNFLRLRRDDSSSTKSFLFGSSYKISTTTSQRDIRKYRLVEVSLRHAATALWVLLEESQPEYLSADLEQSITSFLMRANNFTDKNNDDWGSEPFRFLTLAAISKACDSIIDNSQKTGIVNNASKIKAKALTNIFDDDCCVRSLNGGFSWKMPRTEEQGIAAYEYFLDLFALAMIPSCLSNPAAQFMIKNIISNRVPSGHGYGIPIHPLTTHGVIESICPDFGVSSALLFMLWFSIENNIGGEEWQIYCRENFSWLLAFCISAYDKEQYYLLPYSENNSKVLFLPRFDKNEQRSGEVEEFISKVKAEIYSALTMEKANLIINIQSISSPSGLEHISNLIGMWNIPEHMKKQKKWITENNLGSLSGLAGQFVGGVIKSCL